MADPKNIDNLKEEVNLQEQLKKLISERVVNERTRSSYLGMINNIEEKIVDSGKKQTQSQKELLNLQKRSSDQLKESITLLNTRGVTTIAVGNSLREWERMSNRELELKKQINIEDGIKAEKINLYNKLGLGTSIEYLEKFNNLVKENPFAAALSVLTLLVTDFVKVFTEVDTAAADFRISMGFIRSDTSELEKSVRNSYFNLAQTGIVAKDLYDAIHAVGQSMGTIQASTAAMRDDMALMSAQLGVAVGTSAEFERSMGMMARNTMDSQKDMALFTSRLSAAAGTNLNDVMNDVANATKTSYQFMTRSPLALSKAAVEAKRMGTSISDAAKSADTLIRFTESIKNEMEASVLLGESINLQRLRELAYRRDLAGVNKEILSIAQKSKFEELDPLQQESVAKALGKSADELGKMVQADREMRRIRSDGSLAKQVTDYDRLVGSNESIAKSQAESARYNLTNLSNQQSLKAISLALQAIYQHMFQPIVTFAAVVLPEIAKGLQKFHEWTGAWGAALLGVVGILGIIIGTRGLGKIMSWATGGAGKAVKSLMGDAAGGVSKFGTAEVMKGAIGLLLVGASLIPFAFAMKLMQGIDWKTFFIAASSLGVMLVAVSALGAIMMSGVGTAAILAGAAALLIIGAAMIPFAYATQLFSKALASLEGVDLMGIATGLMSIGSAALMLIPIVPFLPLLSLGFGAFGISLRFVAGPMERVGKAALDLGNGLDKTAIALEKIASLSITQVLSQFKDLSSTISNISKEVNAIPDIKIEKLQNIIVGAANIGAQEAQKADDALLKAMNEVRDSIISLKLSMEKGGISSNVFIDTQKMDSVYARTMAFKGPSSPQPSFG
jgi:hypothetical protein